MKIPFYIPYRAKKEMEYVQDAVANGYISGDGYYTKKVQKMIQEKFGVKKVLMTTSATHALEMAMMLIDLKIGDEVLMPSFTFPSTANAVMLRGGRPVFVEISEATLTMDIEDMVKKITPRTKAIIPVHYGGIGCEMDRIMEIALERGIFVVEDAAQGVNAKYKNRYLGTWGHMGCYSFHGTKNYSCGEGGAILFNSGDDRIQERAEILWQKGTNRTTFMRGEIDQYAWVDIGSSYTPSDILMAFLSAQLEELDSIRERRRLIHQYYMEHLGGLEAEGKVNIMTIPDTCESNYHLFYMRFPHSNMRDKIKEKLAIKGIETAFHFIPLHNSPMGRKCVEREGTLKVTERVSSSLLRLPMYTTMGEEELTYVVTHLNAVMKGEGIDSYGY
jgi:dTDP-4-amino-4,6-dideoxygalactose transaminase